MLILHIASTVCCSEKTLYNKYFILRTTYYIRIGVGKNLVHWWDRK